jgi:GNAT superfamily N-acetyltransferase
MAFTFQPLTAATWDDFVELFGDKGACGGCWCMTWRLKAADFEKGKGDGNKKLIQQLVKKNKPIGVLAYSDNKVAGWCAVAPRNEYIRLENSRVLKPVDNQPVWSISCFFIQKNYRNKGLSKRLVKAAVEYAVSKGAKIIEGYPIDRKPPLPGEVGRGLPDVFAWTGFTSPFIKAGFKEAARRSETRPIMRYYKQ